MLFLLLMNGQCRNAFLNDLRGANGVIESLDDSTIQAIEKTIEFMEYAKLSQDGGFIVVLNWVGEDMNAVYAHPGLLKRTVMEKAPMCKIAKYARDALNMQHSGVEHFRFVLLVESGKPWQVLLEPRQVSAGFTPTLSYEAMA